MEKYSDVVRRMSKQFRRGANNWANIIYGVGPIIGSIGGWAAIKLIEIFLLVPDDAIDLLYWWGPAIGALVGLAIVAIFMHWYYRNKAMLYVWEEQKNKIIDIESQLAETIITHEMQLGDIDSKKSLLCAEIENASSELVLIVTNRGADAKVMGRISISGYVQGGDIRGMDVIWLAADNAGYRLIPKGSSQVIKIADYGSIGSSVREVLKTAWKIYFIKDGKENIKMSSHSAPLRHEPNPKIIPEECIQVIIDVFADPQSSLPLNCTMHLFPMGVVQFIAGVNVVDKTCFAGMFPAKS